MKRNAKALVFLALAASLAALTIPIARADVPDPVGSATTTLTLFGLEVEGSVNPAVSFGVGNGLATTDPERVLLAVPTAKTEFAPLQGLGAEIDDVLKVSVHAEKCEENQPDCTDQDAYTLLSLPMPSQVSQTATGAVDIGAISAEVSPDGLTAFTNLAEATVNADLNSSLISARDLVFGIVNSSDTDSALSSQGIYASSVKVFSIGEMLRLLGRPMEEVSDLEALADALGLPPGASQPLRDAREAYDEAVSDEAEWQAAIAQLADGDLTNDADALQTIGGFATEYANELTACVNAGECASADPADPAVVAATMGMVKSAHQAAIESAREALADDMEEIPLLELEGLTLGVSTEAFDDHAINSALFDWNVARVAGQNIPKPAAINEQIDAIEDAVETTINKIGEAADVEMNAQIELATTSTPQVAQDGPYWTAAAGLTLLTIDVSAAPAEGGQSPQGFEPTSLSADVFSLGAYSEHRPASEPDQILPGPDPSPSPSGSPGPDPSPSPTSSPGPDGNGQNSNDGGDTEVQGGNFQNGGGGPGGGPNSSGSNGTTGFGSGSLDPALVSGSPESYATSEALARTGVQSFLAIGGIGLMGLALMLRRWLGDAA